MNLATMQNTATIDKEQKIEPPNDNHLVWGIPEMVPIPKWIKIYPVTATKIQSQPIFYFRPHAAKQKQHASE